MSDVAPELTGFARLHAIQQAKSRVAVEATPPTASESLPQNESLPSDESLLLNKSLSSDDQEGFRSESLSFTESLPQDGRLRTSKLDVWAGIVETRGHTRLPHAVTDHLFRLLDVSERVVYEQLFRLSWGYGKQVCRVSLPVLAARAGLGKSATHAAIKRLEGKELVRKGAYTFGRNKEQSIEYSLPLPEWLVRNERLSRAESLSSGGSIKETTQIKETHTNTDEPSAVGVGSRFSAEDCRRYATHLNKTGQGIKNPGGYATKIHRTGEADELIAAFLEPTPPAKTVDASRCPDCHGTGYYYPRGTQHGVTRCKHEHLSADTPGANADA